MTEQILIVLALVGEHCGILTGNILETGTGSHDSFFTDFTHQRLIHGKDLSFLLVKFLFGEFEEVGTYLELKIGEVQGFGLLWVDEMFEGFGR